MKRLSDVQAAMRDLVAYALKTELVPERDLVYSINTVLWLMGEDSCDFSQEDVKRRSGRITRRSINDGSFLEATLKVLLDYAASKGMIDGESIVERDMFDTRLMGALTPRPSEVNRMFREWWGSLFLDQNSWELATDYFYKLAQDSDYIRRYRIKRDLKWQTDTEYGALDITINLSKPEKDPKAIAAAGKMRSTAYPRCQLCLENEGYAGRLDHPARENHRVIPLRLGKDMWYMQYSPYVYYNEHCIVFNSEHVPMKIDKGTFKRLLSFVSMFPHYFLGSNADLPIVGGSILSHDHFQGGRYDFAMAKAPVERTFTVQGFSGVRCGVVRWPMSVIRISGGDDAITDLADHILNRWREYTDEDAFIYAYTTEDGQRVPHNTITPIARRNAEKRLEIDLVLRNNITTDEHPLGVYHPHADLHHIKKENIGLIEVMGLAVLPSRLRGELEELKEAILKGSDLHATPSLESHAAWAETFMREYDDINENNIDGILQDEVGKVFLRVLMDAGVFKRTPEGQAAFDRFIASL